MDGLSRAAGAPVDFKLGDQTYLMSPLEIEDIGLIENRIIKDRPNPLAVVGEARDSLPEEVFRELIQQAYQDARSANRATQQEFDEFLASHEGQIFALWLCLRHNHQELTLEFVQSEINKKSREEFAAMQKTMAVGMGTDPLGNSTGGTPETTVAASAETGDKFIASLLESSGGDQKSSTN